MKNKRFDEFDIIQNNLIGVHSIYEFIRSFTIYSKGVGPKLIWTFPVLPILFNKNAVEEIFKKNLNAGSFIKIVNEHSDLFVGLQSRMEQMAQKTFTCISIGTQSNLFGFDSKTSRCYMISSTSIAETKSLSRDYQDILFAAKRLGAWFSKTGEQELLIYLNIKF